MSIEVTTLIENKIGKHLGLNCEHGISFYINVNGNVILFDTGQTGAFINNSKELKVDLSKVKHVALSHGHYDHTGGFRSFVEEIGSNFTLHVSKSFFDKKYGIKDFSYKFLGNNFDENYVKENGISIEYVVDDMEEIEDGVYLFSNFPRLNAYEKINPRFVKEADGGFIVDDFRDEIAVGVDTDEGLLVMVGCSHPGIVNMLEHISNCTRKNIYGILGGTHLVEADDERLEYTIDYFMKKDIKIIGVSHCTGEKAVDRLKDNKRFFYNNSGTSIIIK